MKICDCLAFSLCKSGQCVKHRLQTGGKMQTEDRMQTADQGVKYRFGSLVEVCGHFWFL